MTKDEALRILGLESVTSASQLEKAKRAVMKALHPDTHSADQRPIFERMTRDALEAYLLLLAGLASGVPRGAKTRSSHTSMDSLEVVLFRDSYDSWDRAREAKGNALVAFDRTFAKDEVLALAILGLDQEFSWSTTNNMTGDSAGHSGTALYLVVLNRTDTKVGGMYLGQYAYLIDDRGHQYKASDSTFYWTDDDGHFHSHGSDIAPGAKIDGLLLFPPLRRHSSRFSRLYYAESFSVGEVYHSGEYDIDLTPVTRR